MLNMWSTSDVFLLNSHRYSYIISFLYEAIFDKSEFEKILHDGDVIIIDDDI